MIKNVVLQKCGAKVLLFIHLTKYFLQFYPKQAFFTHLFRNFALKTILT